MSRQVKEQSDELSWRPAAAGILFYLIFRALQFWLSEALSAFIALLGFTLLCYRLARNRRVGFLKWALGSIGISAAGRCPFY